MFGTQLQSNRGGDRFANVSVNFTQQQQQQQQNQQNAHQQQFQAVTQPQQQVFFPQGTQSQFNTVEKEPEWFNNPRKRAIPQAIIKRSTKRSPSEDSGQTVSDSNTSTQRSGFNSLSFGSRKDIRGLPSSQSIKPGNNSDHNTSLLGSNEAPPTVSLYDWQREDEFGAMVPFPSQMTPSTSSLRTDTNPNPLTSTSTSVTKPSTQPNAFDKNGQGINSSRVTMDTDKNGDSANSLAAVINESAVIVFGYPESISNLIITHFSKFGNILEDFEVLRGTSGINTASLRLRGQKSELSTPGRKYPIFTGDGWVKLTYDSSSAAVRALQENGEVFGGCLIGCVPYNKNIVEQLASCKIEKVDDIGGVNFSVKQTPLGESKKGFETLGSNKSSINTPAEALLTQSSNGTSNSMGKNLTPDASSSILEHPKLTYSTRRLDIKDGKSLFAHRGAASNHNFLQSLEIKMRQQEENNKQQAGLLHKVNNWLFGWNDL